MVAILHSQDRRITLEEVTRNVQKNIKWYVSLFCLDEENVLHTRTVNSVPQAVSLLQPFIAANYKQQLCCNDASVILRTETQMLLVAEVPKHVQWNCGW